MTCPGPANMEECDPKVRCLSGDCEGQAYNAANPCPNGGTFNAAKCQCDDVYTELRVVARTVRGFYTGEPPYQPCDPKYTPRCNVWVVVNLSSWGPGDEPDILVADNLGPYCPTEYCNNTTCSIDWITYKIYDSEGNYVGGSWPTQSSTVVLPTETGWQEREIVAIYGYGSTSQEANTDAQAQQDALPSCFD